MANPPKKKGTGFEAELEKALVEFIVSTGAADQLLAEDAVHRQPAGAPYDILVYGADGHVVEALATRPDRGQTLVTLRLQDFLEMWYAGMYPPDLHIEAKRYSRFSLHSIFEKKFGRK